MRIVIILVPGEVAGLFDFSMLSFSPHAKGCHGHMNIELEFAMIMFIIEQLSAKLTLTITIMHNAASIQNNLNSRCWDKMSCYHFTRYKPPRGRSTGEPGSSAATTTRG